ENVRAWTKLEAMQEIRINDVDKRVSHILTDLKAGYGVYTQLFFSAADDRGVGASDSHFLCKENPDQTPWLTAALPPRAVEIEPLSLSPLESFLNIRAAIADTFQKNEKDEKIIGALYASFDWTEIFRLLDQADQHSPLPGQRMAVVLDHEGRIIAASSLLRQ